MNELAQALPRIKNTKARRTSKKRCWRCDGTGFEWPSFGNMGHRPVCRTCGGHGWVRDSDTNL